MVATLSWEAGLNDVVQGEDPLLTVAEIARGLGIQPSTWRGYVTRGEAPPADEPDADRPPARRMPRWRQSSVAAWKVGRKRGSYKKAGDGE